MLLGIASESLGRVRIVESRRVPGVVSPVRVAVPSRDDPGVEALFLQGFGEASGDVSASEREGVVLERHDAQTPVVVGTEFVLHVLGVVGVEVHVLRSGDVVAPVVFGPGVHVLPDGGF